MNFNSRFLAALVAANSCHVDETVPIARDCDRRFLFVSFDEIPASVRLEPLTEKVLIKACVPRIERERPARDWEQRQHPKHRCNRNR